MKIARAALTALIILAALTLGATRAAAVESILDFHSRVVIDRDAGLTVTETIQVRAERREIKRGIVRDFPTTYTDRLGRRTVVGFEVLSVARDGKTEPYHIKDAGNGKKVFIGDRNVLLNPGVYTYTIKYRTDRQIGFFENYDELYWNATGNDWTFPIEKARATIVLPPGARVINVAGYTGRQGAQGKNFTVSKTMDGSVVFTTTAPLPRHNGLTVAVSWPKGIVTPPSREQELAWALSDNAHLVLGLAGLALLLIYYIFAWLKVGRDPAKGTLVPRFEPPQGISPAGARFLDRMAYDNKNFAAALVSMAVKGYLQIIDDKGKFSLKRLTTDRSKLTTGEAKIAASLFHPKDEIELKNKNHRRIANAKKQLKKALSQEFEKVYFHTNRAWMLPGLGLSLLVLLAMIFTSQEPESAGFLTLWLTGWSVGCYFLVSRALNQWRSALAGRASIGGILLALIFTGFTLPFLGGEIMALAFFSQVSSFWNLFLLAVIIAVNALFLFLLKAPTIHGQKIMDHLDGFKHYLSVAETDRLAYLHPPEKTPELFEKYLPYALALGVEHKWSESFTFLLDRAADQGPGYHPIWYSGTSLSRLGGGALASSLGGALSGAIASSSTAPGSSSGSGGGGSSGGGGGGGGGSGW